MFLIRVFIRSYQFLVAPILAWACGLRTVFPQSIPAAERSLE